MKTNIKTNVSVVLVTLITTIFLFSSCVVSEEFLNELFYEPDYTSEEVSEEEIVSSDFSTTVSGSYLSEDWGEIILTQQGNQVTGKYDYGTMRGTLTGNRLEGSWEGTFGGMGKMILDFSSDASSFSGYYASGYEDPVPSNLNSIRWTGNRIGSSLSTGQIEEILGGWIDTNESLSGFIFKPDNSLILFFDGEIAEGYWENSANSLSLFVENATGEFIIFESFYEFDGANLHLYSDNDHLILEKHWVATAEDIFTYYRQLGIGGGVPSGELSDSIAGVYDTNFGKLTLTKSGSSFIGEYPMGELTGTLSGNVFSGSFASMGTNGQFTITFTSDGREFSGKMIVDQYTDYLWEGEKLD